MNDFDIINEFSDKNGKIDPHKTREKWLNGHGEIKLYLKNRFPNDDFISYKFVLQRIFNHVENLPICENCGKKIYKSDNQKHRWCSIKCQLTDKNFIKWRSENSDEESRSRKWKESYYRKSPEEKQASIEKQIKSKIKKYGKDFGKIINKKTQKTTEEKYGCKCVFESEEIKKKSKKTKLLKYGNENYVNPEKAKRTCIEHFGVDSYLKSDNFKEWLLKQSPDNKILYLSSSQIPKIKEKILNSKRKNHTFNVSKPEEKAFKVLKEAFGKENVLRQYKSKVYPFNCDFYIKSLDLYNELNFHWTHGGHPFNSLNIEDKEKLNLWKNKNTKYYNRAIEIWTHSDVLKIKLAHKNHINFIFFYEEDDFNLWVESL